MSTPVCQWPSHQPSEDEESLVCGPVVARIGLPGSSAIWVCQSAFDEWQKKRS